jgi:hypothetical protein
MRLPAFTVQRTALDSLVQAVKTDSEASEAEADEAAESDPHA